MKLTEREPQFLESYGVRCNLAFRCPCKPDCDAMICIPFSPPLDGKAYPTEMKADSWQRERGDMFETLTLTPSILLHATEHDGHPGWHGFLTNGELVTC